MDNIIIDDTQLVGIKLNRAISDYMEFCRVTRRLSKGTLIQYRCALEILVTVCGNTLPVHTLSSTHMTWALDKATKGDTPTEAISRTNGLGNHARQRKGRTGLSLNVNMSVYRQFARWCQGQRYLSPYRDPCQGFRWVKSSSVKREWKRKWTVPVDLRGVLLDAAGDTHPRDRFVVAMGLFGGRRTSDIKLMKIKDIDLDNETFTFDNTKTRKMGIELPILWPEFMQEIRRWMAWYAGQHGELNPNWYLIPRRLSSREYTTIGDKHFRMHQGWPVDPELPAYDTGLDVAKALEIIGAPVEQRLGMHTLRHSCAVWLLDHLGWNFYDVAEWLDHSDPRVTRATYMQGADVIKRLRERYQKVDPTAMANVIPFLDPRWRKLEQMSEDETA